MERTSCQSGVGLIGAVGGAYDAGLAPRRSSGVTRPPCIDEGYPGASAQEVKRSPSPEGSGPDNRNMEFSHRCCGPSVQSGLTEYRIGIVLIKKTAESSALSLREC